MGACALFILCIFGLIIANFLPMLDLLMLPYVEAQSECLVSEISSKDLCNLHCFREAASKKQTKSLRAQFYAQEIVGHEKATKF